MNTDKHALFVAICGYLWFLFSGPISLFERYLSETGKRHRAGTTNSTNIMAIAKSYVKRGARGALPLATHYGGVLGRLCRPKTPPQPAAARRKYLFSGCCKVFCRMTEDFATAMPRIFLLLPIFYVVGIMAWCRGEVTEWLNVLVSKMSKG